MLLLPVLLPVHVLPVLLPVRVLPVLLLAMLVPACYCLCCCRLLPTMLLPILSALL